MGKGILNVFVLFLSFCSVLNKSSLNLSLSRVLLLKVQVLIAQTLDSSLQGINHYPVDKSLSSGYVLLHYTTSKITQFQPSNLLTSSAGTALLLRIEGTKMQSVSFQWVWRY